MASPLARRLTAEDKAGLDLALERRAAITLAVLSLPEAGPPPDDSRLQLLLSGVSRAAASLRLGMWNDPSAPIAHFPPGDLLAVVQSFGGCSSYGGEFFDVAEKELFA